MIQGFIIGVLIVVLIAVERDRREWKQISIEQHATVNTANEAMKKLGKYLAKEAEK